MLLLVQINFVKPVNFSIPVISVMDELWQSRLVRVASCSSLIVSVACISNTAATSEAKLSSGNQSLKLCV